MGAAGSRGRTGRPTAAAATTTARGRRVAAVAVAACFGSGLPTLHEATETLLAPAAGWVLLGAAGCARDTYGCYYFPRNSKQMEAKKPEPWLLDQRHGGPSSSNACACPREPSPARQKQHPGCSPCPGCSRPCTAPAASLPPRSRGRTLKRGLCPCASAAARLFSWEKASGELERKRTSRKPL